jgi:alpha-galactosidase/6-phospho-beta-glucosidase family protein
MLFETFMMLLDPVIDSVRVAEQVLDEMLQAQKDYLPAFGMG